MEFFRSFPFGARQYRIGDQKREAFLLILSTFHHNNHQAISDRVQSPTT